MIEDLRIDLRDCRPADLLEQREPFSQHPYGKPARTLLPSAKTSAAPIPTAPAIMANVANAFATGAAPVTLAPASAGTQVAQAVAAAVAPTTIAASFSQHPYGKPGRTPLLSAKTSAAPTATTSATLATVGIATNIRCEPRLFHLFKSSTLQ
ncbi:hypothetical protein LZ554_003023 [Drepanopeziza brunnea f. sp. 'monogermtubi']|nr:hypothetical protein LZ554_003023 [Drepanopeziza brunnea f. sp. 'monogermtubi']